MVRLGYVIRLLKCGGFEYGRIFIDNFTLLGIALKLIIFWGRFFTGVRAKDNPNLGC